jgi:hypothetical protein
VGTSPTVFYPDQRCSISAFALVSFLRYTGPVISAYHQTWNCQKNKGSEKSLHTLEGQLHFSFIQTQFHQSTIASINVWFNNQWKPVKS